MLCSSRPRIAPSTAAVEIEFVVGRVHDDGGKARLGGRRSGRRSRTGRDIEEAVCRGGGESAAAERPIFVNINAANFTTRPNRAANSKNQA